MDVNRHGLSRRIPDPVMRAVRQACGYGCVLCGCAIYQYEHVDPPFAEAREHDPDSMALICGTCHDKKTRGLLSTRAVMIARHAPAAKREGFSSLLLEVSPDSAPTVRVGQTEFGRLRDILIIDGESLLSVSPPECAGAPPRINATFYSRSGELVARIVDNEWRGESSAFDIETAGSRVTIRSKPGDIDLSLRIAPPHGIVLERLRMCHNGKTVAGNSKQGFEFSTREASVVIPPAARIVETAPFWLSIQEEEVLIGTGDVLRVRGAKLLEVKPSSEGIAQSPGSPVDHTVTKVVKLSPPGRPGTLSSFRWRTPKGEFVPVWPDCSCPCGSGKPFRDCCQPPGFFDLA